MSRRLRRLIGIPPPVFILVAALASAAETESAHSFKFTIASKLDMQVQGQNEKINADTVMNYSWKQRGPERTLVFDSTLVKADIDGKSMMDVFMSRAKFTNTADGKTDEVPYENAPEALKTMLRDSFGVPVCKIQVDETGKELKREVIAGAGAKQLIEQGIIANALLFHPPFMRDKNEWSAPAEVSMGNGGFAKGRLNYKKVDGGKNIQAVKVSGTLTNDGFIVPNSPLKMKSAKYVVNGDQTFDPAQKEWTSGKLTIDVSYEMSATGQPVGFAKGTMAVSLEKSANKK